LFGECVKIEPSHLSYTFINFSVAKIGEKTIRAKQNGTFLHKNIAQVTISTK
jgi:hypothetical protein